MIPLTHRHCICTKIICDLQHGGNRGPRFGSDARDQVVMQGRELQTRVRGVSKHDDLLDKLALNNGINGLE